jgi:hypothetical protein
MSTMPSRRPRPRALALILGIALICALTASRPGTARAGEFVAEGVSTAKFSGAQIASERFFFILDGSEAYCEKGTFTTGGEVGSPTKSLFVQPTFSECTAFGFSSATITTTGCEYHFLFPSKIATNVYTGEWFLNCSGSNKLIIKGGTCEVQMTNQGFGESLELTNKGGWIKTELKIFKKAPMKVTQDGFLCPLTGTGERNGSVVGAAEMTTSHLGTTVLATMDGS